MPRLAIPLLALLATVTNCASQAPGPPDPPDLPNPELGKQLQEIMTFSVPLIGVEELQEIKPEVHIFDTRKRSEFEASHIEGAVFLGYEPPQWEAIRGLPRDTTVVVYCSVGYRSEAVGKLLEERGFRDVRNLYGGLFAWVDQGLPVVDTAGKTTLTVHTYNADWSQWLRAPHIHKVW